MNVSHDTESVIASANGYSANNDVSELAATFREAQAEYFDENVAGERVTGLTTSVLGAAIAIVRGEAAAHAYEQIGKAGSKEDLIDELEASLREAGFSEDGELTVNVSEHSVGPILPVLVGILAQTHHVEV